MPKYYKFWYFRPPKAIVDLIKGKWLSRTDKFVSARENYFYGKLPKVLPKNVILLGEEEINKVLSKEYRYILPKREAWKQVSYLLRLDNEIVRKSKIRVKDKLPDVNLMKEAMRFFLGKHDFSNFTINREIRNPYCTIFAFDLIEIEYLNLFELKSSSLIYLKG